MKKVRLGEIFNLQMGKTPAREKLSFWGGTNKWISISDIGNSEKYISSTKESITDEAVRKSGIKIVPKGTVIMSFKLSIGKVAITSEDMYSNEAIMAFIDKKICHIDTNYLYYLLGGKDWNLGTNKAVMGLTLNKATLSQIEIEIPPIEKQIYVSSVLDKVSDLIALRKQQLAKLDELVKARFVEMFGDPEFNTKSWPIQPLGELCNVGSSKRIYQNELCQKGIPFWRISDLVSKMDTGVAESGLFIPEEKYLELKREGLVPITGDILITSRGTLGRCYIISNKDRFYFQDGMISWLSSYAESITPLYLQYLFMMSGFRKQIDSMQAGSTVAYLSIAMLKKLMIMMPNKDEQKCFANFVAQIDKSKFEIKKSLEELNLLKKSLMQEYFG